MNSLNDLLSFHWLKTARKKHDEFRQAYTEFSKSLMLIVDLEQLQDNVIARIQENPMLNRTSSILK